MTEKYGTFGFTPEMSTCEAASDSVPDDEWEAEDCGSGFEFPDDEGLVQAEFENNIPFALSVAESAEDPDDPVSVVGREAEDFRVDSFDVSYGDPQTVAVAAKRALKHLKLNYRINNGKTKTPGAPSGCGGERYGARERPLLRRVPRRGKGARAGDRVKVWFSGEKKRGPARRRRRAASFTYTVKSDTGAKVLVLADEDYNGRQPDFPNPPGRRPEVRRGAPRRGPRGRLQRRPVGHRCAGRPARPRRARPLQGDRLVPRRQPHHPGPEDFLTRRRSRAARHRGRRARAVPDDGGARLPQRGRQAHPRGRDGAVLRLPGISDVVGGLYYGLNGDADGGVRHHTVPGFFEDCLILADDFRQYYLGAFTRVSLSVAPDVVDGIAAPITGYQARWRARRRTRSTRRACSSRPATCCRRRVPAVRRARAPRSQLQRAARSRRSRAEATPAALHADASYMRLDADDRPAGGDRGAGAAAAVPALDQHRAVVRQRDRRGAHGRPGRLDDPARPQRRDADQRRRPSARPGVPAGAAPVPAALPRRRRTAGTGPSGHVERVHRLDRRLEAAAFDLSAYAGKQVEMSIAYVTDPAAAASARSSTTRGS